MAVRQYTQKGDPQLRATLPIALIRALKEEARKTKRPYQDELAKRILATFKNNVEYRAQASVFPKKLSHEKDMVSYRQIISRDILNLLRRAAEADQHSLEEELYLRLKIGFSQPLAVGTSQMYTKIMRYKPTYKEMKDQKLLMKRGQRYVYELKQLELNIRNESWLGKDLKFKSFELIDVVAETAKIRMLLEEERGEIKDQGGSFGFI